MINVKTAILAGAVVVGLAGFTAYASGTFCTTETAQAQPAQAVFTSGGDKSCCADDKATATTTAQNAIFTPTVQTAALAGGTCPASATQQAALTANGETCGAKAAVTTASLTSNDKSCCATDGNKAKASKTSLAVVIPTATTTN